MARRRRAKGKRGKRKKIGAPQARPKGGNGAPQARQKAKNEENMCAAGAQKEENACFGLFSLPVYRYAGLHVLYIFYLARDIYEITHLPVIGVRGARVGGAASQSCICQPAS